jgi:hypothetical protein
MYRIFTVIILSCAGLATDLHAQDTLSKVQEIEEVRVLKNFNGQYNARLKMLRRVYPLALHAKEMLRAYEEDLTAIEKQRKRKRYSKNAQKALKEEFNFNIKDLYKSEGRLLMRLIQRETGLTVAQIIGKYRGSSSMKFQTALAKVYGQDLTAHYEPLTLDYITEIVIDDIHSGAVAFDASMTPMSKIAFKKEMKKYRSTIRESHKNSRKRRRAQKRK